MNAFNVLSGLIDFAFDAFVLVGVPFLIVRSVRRGMKRGREKRNAPKRGREKRNAPVVRTESSTVHDDNPWAGWRKDSEWPS